MAVENTTHQPKPVVFAVMGATGTGNSTFIHLLTNDEKIHIGHGQDSETFEVRTSTYIDKDTGRSVMLIDTPGFDDSREGVTDTDILQKIVEYLEPGNGERRKLNGVIYMHRISDPRVGGVSRRNLRMFYALCGEETLSNVRIVTTNWGRVGEEEGSRREADLRSGAFKALVDAGAQMRRHENNLESAHRIMAEVIPLPEVVTQVQRQVEAGMRLADTAPGQVLTAEMREMQKRHEREMAGLKREMELAAQANDRALRAELAQERKVLEEKIARVEADREKLERTLEEERRIQESRRKEEAAQLTRLMDHMMEERRIAQAQMDKAQEYEWQLRKDTAERQLQLERHLADANSRMVDLANRDSGGGCVIC